MRRLLYFWLALLGATWLGSALLAILGAIGAPGGAALVAGREERLFAWTLVPLTQALAVGWLTRGEGRRARPVLPAGAARAILFSLLGLAIALGLVGGLLNEDPWWSLRGEIPPAFAAILALAAAVAAGRAALAGPDRAPSALLALLLVAVAAEVELGLLGRALAPLADPALGRAAATVALGTAASALLLSLERRWRNLTPTAARWLEIALGLGLGAGLLDLLRRELRPEVGQPMLVVAALSGLLALLSLLAAFAHRSTVRPAS